MKHTSLLITSALAIAVFGVFVISQPSSAQVAVNCPAGYSCTQQPVTCPVGYLCLPNGTANSAATYIPGTWFNSTLGGGTTINHLGNYKCVTASGTIYAADAAQCSDLQKDNIGVGVQGNITTSSPDSQPDVSVSSSSITVTQYNANGTVKSTANYLTAIPTNAGITSDGQNITYTAYRSCTGIAGSTGSACYQGNGSVTITNVANITAQACPAGASCLDSLPAQSAFSIKPLPTCKYSLSFDAANRLVALVPQAASILSAANLHLAAIATIGNSTVTQQIVPRTGTVISANPNFDGSSLSPNVIQQTRTTTKSARAVFDLCLDAGYSANLAPGMNAAAIISANTPATQYVIFNVPNN